MIGHYKKKSLPEADFAGIEALHAHTKELLNTKNSDISKAERAKTSIAMCDMIEHITKTSLKPEKVQELLCQVSSNPQILFSCTCNILCIAMFPHIRT